MKTKHNSSHIFLILDMVLLSQLYHLLRNGIFYLEFGINKVSAIMGRMALVKLSWGSKSNNIVCKRSSYINSHIMNCGREGRMRRGKEQLIFEQGISIHRYRAQMQKPLKCQCEAFYGFLSQSQRDSPRHSLFARMQSLGCINVNVE